MARSGGIGLSAAALAAGLMLLLTLAGCAGRTSSQSVTSLVRARPTTPPETYSLQMGGAVRTLSDALGKLSALLANPRYLDDAWKSDAINLATVVELGYRQLEGLAPPNPQQEKHNATVQAVQDCQMLTVYVFQGINNLDKGPFDEAKQRVELCRNKLDLATGAAVAIKAESQPASFEAARPEIHARTKRGANLRGGPGTSYPLVATAREGDTFTVTGRTAKGDWLQVTGGKATNAWIAVFLVEADGDLNSVPIINQVNP